MANTTVRMVQQLNMLTVIKSGGYIITFIELTALQLNMLMVVKSGGYMITFIELMALQLNMLMVIKGGTCLVKNTLRRPIGKKFTKEV